MPTDATPGQPDAPDGPPLRDLTLPVLGGSVPAAMEPTEALPPDPLPFPEALMGEAIRAAARLWEPLAARAWEETANRGRGLLALRWEELRAAAAAMDEAGAGEGSDGDSDRENPGRPSTDDGPPATWIPLTIVSRGDDFRGLLKQYDPHRQVMLLIAHADGGEAVFGLECDGDRRPAPAECHARRVARAGDQPTADAPPSDPGPGQ